MPQDIFVALMGVTGAGKSTFISHCTDEPVEVGHRLQACTQEVRVYNCAFSPGVNVKLVDTPGFDDTNRSDTEVLREIASWLTASYSSSIKLRGIIYLHRISDRRMPGSARRNLFMFKKLCGPDALRHVILATTMWESVGFQDAVARENELKDTPDFWGHMISKGSRMERHTDDRESAMRLISQFASPKSSASDFVVDLQKEMVDQGKSFNQTSAGIELEGELAKERKRFQQEIKNLQDDMRAARQAQDEESSRELQRQKERMDRELQRLQAEQQDLQRDLQRQHDRKFAELQSELRAARADADAREARQAEILRQEQAAREQRERLHQAEVERLQQRLTVATLQQKGKAKASQSQAPPTQSPSPLPKIKRPIVIPDKRHDVYSLSIVGKSYCFVGGNHCFWKFCSTYSLEKAHKKAEHSLNYVALGVKGSWYRQYRIKADGHEFSQRSGDIDDQYSQLSANMKKHKLSGVPKCLSLGTNGMYFASFESRTLRALGDDLKKHAGEAKELKKVWFGANEAYVAVRLDGRIRWDLKGGYPGLAKKLKATSTAPMALAMDLEENDGWFGVWERGAYACHSGTHLEVIQEFLMRNGWKTEA